LFDGRKFPKTAEVGRSGMRAITLWQLFATLVAVGAKKIETRGWPTSYRGPLAIHAGTSKRGTSMAGFMVSCREVLKDHGWEGPLPLGRFVAVCRLVDCLKTESVAGRISKLERSLGDFSPGRFAWVLEDAKRLGRTYEIRGHQGLWNPPPVEWVTL